MSHGRPADYIRCPFDTGELQGWVEGRDGDWWGKITSGTEEIVLPPFESHPTREAALGALVRLAEREPRLLAGRRSAARGPRSYERGESNA